MLDWIGRQALFALDPETAHAVSIAALRSGLVRAAPVRDPRLALSVAGIDFPNPLGMAAGYDKDALVPDALLGLGFGFAEVGTLTPRAQAGNPRPRIFRLPGEGAVINRLGFNNGGHDAAWRRLAGRRRRGIVGVNVGANKDSADRDADYVEGVRRFADVADYLTVNVSSPNTPGLRDLQEHGRLTRLLALVLEARDRALRPGQRLPVFLKIAPDLGEGDLDDIASALGGAGADGLVVSNTTVARDGLSRGVHRGETGGLSGRPLFARSTAVLARMRQRLGPDVAIIGAGGVADADSAIEKIRAGADLVQLYTAMIYAGPGLARRILRDLARIIPEGATPRTLRDTRMAHWAGEPIA